MSALSCATIESIGTVGCDVNHSDPNSPSSSPVCHTNSIDRRGGDAALRGTYVAFGAHLDHIGIQPPEDGDSIANGADDDGTGSVALLAIARAAVAQRPPPRRSMLFVWHTGEELGLFGSEWFTSHPTVPIDSIVAQLNADMIGRNSRNSLYLVGPYAAPNHQSAVLGAIADSVNRSLKDPFTIDREWDSPTHPCLLYTS